MVGPNELRLLLPLLSLRSLATAFLLRQTRCNHRAPLARDGSGDDSWVSVDHINEIRSSMSVKCIVSIVRGDERAGGQVRPADADQQGCSDGHWPHQSARSPREHAEWEIWVRRGIWGCKNCAVTAKTQIWQLTKIRVSVKTGSKKEK